MAILLYSGTPGSGKSLHAAKTITEWFQKGKPVITNFELDTAKYPKAIHTCVDEDDLTPAFLSDYALSYFGDRKITKKDEDTILLVIDECQLMFNSREYQKKDRKIWIKFFTQHRKLGYHVILIAQMDKMLDKQIRGVIEYEYIHRKLSNYGKAGKLLTVFLAGEMFTSVQMWYPLKLKVGNSMFRAKKKYFSIYDSYVTFGDQKQAPAEPVAAASDAAETVSPAEEQKPKKQRCSTLDLGLIRAKLSVLGRLRKLNLQAFTFPATVKVGWWLVYSGSGKHLQKFPEGRTETGWR